MKIRTVKELLDLIMKRRRSAMINGAMLATSANVSPKFISQLENGKETVEVDSLVKVAHALGMNIPVLFNPARTGAIVTAKRKELGLDQITGAALCNVSPRFLSTIENGKPKKRLNKLFDVLKGFGIDVEVMV
ncbi:MAG: transcriptional regulator with XRE-family HTH domain [Oleiphilaceae bacterium]|jgi:transcriptional regulator with XRE-family HTH domain